MMNEPLKITYRHGDHEVSVQVDNCGGHISEAFDVFFDVLKGAGFHEESIENYWKRIEGVYNKITK